MTGRIQRLARALFFRWLAATPLCLSSEVSLPLGDVNVMVVTDTHSWVAGHGYHEPNLNADYGDVLSFYERLKHACRENRKDLWFVMNGDFIHGTGLSMNPPVSLVPLLEKMPWDALNIGNHELQEDETVEYMMRPGGFIDWWGDAYLTSNVVHASNGKPLGRRYRLLHGKYQNTTLLTFGFLFDMLGASGHVTVERVEVVVKSQWFLAALRGNSFNAVMVLAHMDVQDPLVSVLLAAIRKECGPEMPVQFITGHTHYRGHVMVDDASSSFEAGRYLDTVGFVSFPVKHSNSTFNHVFLDANKDVLRSTLGVSTLSTESGTALSEFIRDTQESLGLLEVVGCSPNRFREAVALDEFDSLWGLYLSKVVPYQLFQGDPSKVLVQQTAWYFRYDLFSDRVTVTDIATIVPIDDTLYHIAPQVQGTTVKQLVEALGTEVYLNGTLPSFWFSGNVQDNDLYDLYTISSNVKRVMDALGALNMRPNAPQELFGGNRTVRSLWKEFIADYWPCRGQSKQPVTFGNSENNMASRHSKRSFWLVVFIAAIMLPFISLVVRNMPTWWQRHGRESIPSAEQRELTLVI